MAREKTCNHCGHKSPSKSVVCQTCGRKFGAPKKRQSRSFEDNIIDQKEPRAKNKGNTPDFRFDDYRMKPGYSVVLQVILILLWFWPGVIYFFLNLEKKK